MKPPFMKYSKVRSFMVNPSLFKHGRLLQLLVKSERPLPPLSTSGDALMPKSEKEIIS